MKVSVKIDEDVKTELVKYAGKLQAKTGQTVTISDAIKALLASQESDSMTTKGES